MEEKFQKEIILDRLLFISFFNCQIGEKFSSLLKKGKKYSKDNKW